MAFYAAKRGLGASARTAHDMLVFVLCPLRRALEDGLFHGTRLQFMERGFPAVKRLQGYDLKGGGLRVKGAKPNQVVMTAVEEVFLPRAARVFDSAPHVNIISLAEDYCALRSHVGVWTVRIACGDTTRRSATWLGYYTIRHEPTGAHLVGFSRRALLSFQEDLRATHGRDHS